MDDKLGLQSRAPEKCHDQIFEEIEGLEEKKSEEGYANCAEEARYMEISE